ncbi:MAG: alpha/beta hydrolase-fold protein, partial [Ferruginibacter sp.]
MNYKTTCCFLSISLLFFSCKHPVKQQADSIYSRHLQRHVVLTVITTPMSADKEEMNLLLLNNGADLQQLEAKKIIDSLYKNKLIQPLTLVGIAGNVDEYGLSGADEKTGPGKYNNFIRNELYPFIKKKVALRKFKSIATVGCARAGISAFDIAWNNADKIDKAGILSADFDYAGKTGSVSNALEFIKASRKRPHLQLWLYAAENKDSTILKNTKTFRQILVDK